MIVCDTLIWYKIVPEKIKNKHELVATLLSMIELYKSSDRKEGVIISVWKRLSNDSTYKNLFSPEQHFYRFSLNKIIQFSAIYQQIETAKKYDKIIEKAEQRELTDTDWETFHAEAAKIRVFFNQNFNRFTEFINDYRKYELKDKDRNKYLRSETGINDHLEYITKPLIIKLLTDNNPEINDSEKVGCFAEIELFTYTFNRWLLDLDVEGEMATVNDVIDLFNMIYVGQTDKYWTEEKKWLRKVKKAGMGHYLFDPQLK